MQRSFLFILALPIGLAHAAPFKHQAHVTIDHTTKADTAAWQKLKPLRFSLPTLGLFRTLYYRDRTPHPFDGEFKRVRTLLIDEHDATPLSVTTDDGHQLSALACIRPHATTTLLFFTGYFDYLTPPKEWVAPFVGLFPNCNVVMFDWRHVGENPNKKEARKNFGKTAHHDVMAMLRLCRTHEGMKDTTLIAHSYCLGGAVLLDALVNHLPDSFLMPDALNLSSVPATISAIKKTYHLGNPSWLFRTAFSFPPIRNYSFNKSISSDIRELNPAELLKKLSIPCNLEYCITGDCMVPLEMSIPAAYDELPANIHLTLAKKSRHVRLQTLADQYVTAQELFWEKVT